MSATLLFGLIIFVLASSITPGPNNLMLLASGVNFGIRRTLPHMAGIGVGCALLVGLVTLGIGAMFKAVPWLETALKIGCVAYMLYLAFRIARAGAIGAPGEGGAARPMRFIEAVGFQWINPKAWAMALTAAATYGAEGGPARAGLIALVFGIVNLPCIGCWALFGVALRRFLGDERRVRVFNGIMALLLVASILPFLQ